MYFRFTVSHNHVWAFAGVGCLGRIFHDLCVCTLPANVKFWVINWLWVMEMSGRWEKVAADLSKGWVLIGDVDKGKIAGTETYGFVYIFVPMICLFIEWTICPCDLFEKWKTQTYNFELDRERWVSILQTNLELQEPRLTLIKTKIWTKLML